MNDTIVSINGNDFKVIPESRRKAGVVVAQGERAEDASMGVSEACSEGLREPRKSGDEQVTVG